MSPNEFPCSVPEQPAWGLPAFIWRQLAMLFLSMLIMAYISGCMVGQEQERDLQKAREKACQADPHCLRP